MEVLFALFLLGTLVFFVVGLPVWAMALASRAKRRNQELEEQVQGLHARVLHLEELAKRSDGTAGASPAASTPDDGERVAGLAAVAAEPARERRELEQAVREQSRLGMLEPQAASDSSAATLPLQPTPVPAPMHAAAPATGLPSQAFAAARRFDFERLIGVRLFAWVGGGALFLGAALALDYSIEHDLISPALRVALAMLVGVGALFLGDGMRQRAQVAGQALAGAGIAILYAALYAARSLYDLLGGVPSFAAMVLVTLTAGALAVKRGAYLVAVLGLLGGMATPYLLSTGSDRPLALFCYVLLLDMGVLFAARRRNWPSLGLLGFASSLVIFVAWADRHLSATRGPWALLALLAASAVFLAFSVAGSTLLARASTRGSAIDKLLVGGVVVAPLVLTLWIVGLPSLELEPPVLAADLIAISALSWFASRSGAGPWLPPLAAILSSVALLARVDHELIREGAFVALASFATVPAAYAGLWFWRRSRADEKPLRIASGISWLGAAGVVAVLPEVAANSLTFSLVLAYSSFHAAGLASLAYVCQRGGWALLAQLAALLGYARLAVEQRAEPPTALILVIAGSALLFWALPLLGRRWRADRAGWYSSAVALVLHFLLLHYLCRDAWGSGPLGALALGAAALSLVSLRGALLHQTGVRALSALFAGLTLSFITAAVPIWLHNEWLTMAWALEVAALAWLWRRIHHPGLLAMIALLALGVSIRLLANPALWTYHPRLARPILNFYLYTFGLPALSFLTAAWLLERCNQRWLGALRAFLGVSGAVFLFFLLNVEIADYFSSGSTITFRFSGAGLARDMTYSLGWGVFGVLLLVVGIVSRRRAARLAALAVIMLTMLKVFAHDLWALGALYRVGSIVGLSLSLFVVSFLIQRYSSNRV